MARLAHPNPLKAWRERRGLTQAELADAAGTNRVVISLLEERDRGLSEKWRLKLAPLVDVRPDDLNSDPNKG